MAVEWHSSHNKREHGTNQDLEADVLRNEIKRFNESLYDKKLLQPPGKKTKYHHQAELFSIINCQFSIIMLDASSAYTINS